MNVRKPHSDPVVGGRNQAVLQLRSAGQTFEQIGSFLGVSGVRAGQIYRRAKREAEEIMEMTSLVVSPTTPIDQLPLSTRTRRALLFGGFDNVSDLLPFDNEKQRRLSALPNLGRSGMTEIREAMSTLASE
ncbi:DNA-directed RNA polymerase subunit alpha C-terminal domain-containing protein (plasmid) [Novosphingobium sp. BL-8A]|uniref:DNA-directed RNA polymerase subunit alpha C-terminal domain-containing protein n=1 Tax=Novosphingobium sp. BL-8A TaxID=3127639 RepID=UPI003757E8AB